jgi:amino acid adenylation domain-containing protein
VGRGDRVAILAEKTPAAIVSMLASLKAGGIYVPLDVASPAARTRSIMDAVEPAVLLASAAAQDRLDELRANGELAATVGFLGTGSTAASGTAFALEDARSERCDPLGLRRDEDDPAHILFTSGSTGVPKGVVITHRNVSAFLDWATRYFGTAPGDRISGHPPLHFDLSTFDIYATLWAGAELHLVPPGLLLPKQLADFIVEAELTQWFSVPSTFTYMARRGGIPPSGFPSLERVIWCGDVLPPPIVAEWMRRVPQARYTNLYGPTEATIASSFYTVPTVPEDETRSIPIGTAIPGEELLVLDDAGKELAAGEIGELYIAGDGLSPGYWRNRRETERAFLEDPRRDGNGSRVYRTGDLAFLGDDSLYRFVGRDDSQVKSRGYRIELGEVEAALGAFEGLTEFAVVGVASDDFEGTAICCAYVPVAGTAITTATIRTGLATRLPPYMLPTRWLELPELPKNVNGKIDRAALRVLFDAPNHVQPVAAPA